MKTEEEFTIDQFMRENFRWIGIMQGIGIILIFGSIFSLIWTSFLISLKLFLTGLAIVLLMYFIYKFFLKETKEEFKKMLDELESKRPKPKSSFSTRLENAMKEQQEKINGK